MKNTKRSVLCLSVLSALSVSGCGTKIPAVPTNWDEGVQWTSEGETKYNALSGLARDSTYRAYETYFPSTLNTAVTMQKEDSQIITNFIDGLVEVNRYGRIVPDIAESWSKNAEESEFVFQIRDGVKWMTNDGNPYQINGEQAYVTAQDFVKGAMENLKFQNMSKSSYLLTMFIDGAQEYYSYTQLRYYQMTGGGRVTTAALGTQPTDEKEAKVWTTCSSRVGGIVSGTHSCAPYTEPLKDSDIAGALGVNVSELASIDNFSRVGVKASNGNKTLTYTLVGTMPYFLSALTYTPFLPIQTEFYEKVGASNYGKNRKNILANGAFLLSYFPSATATKIVMNKNMEYFDAKNVKIGRVELYRLVSDTTPSTGREGFESGTTDSFVVNIRDTIGWEKYVTGTDKTGTRENPANADAFTKESVGDGSTFTFALNSERDPSQDGPTVTGSIFAKNPWNETDADNRNINIVNANKALKLKSVRKLILSSLDFPTYNTSNGNDPYEQVKEAVNTYTPHDFYIVQGENDKVKSPDFLSYIEGAYIDRYLGERTDENWKKAEDLLGPGSIGGVAVATKPISEQTDADKAEYTSAYQTMYSAAKADIDAYNAANPNDKINLPIVIEYTGLAYNNDSDTYDRRFVNQTNANMNGCWVGGSDPEVSEGRPTNVTVCPDSGSGYGSQELVRIVKNTRDNIPQGDDYSIVTNNGATTLFVTGWGPDYSDPLTYASTLVKDGDLCDYFGVCSNSDAAIDAQVDELIGPYTELVEKANAIIEPVKRAEAFAEAEVELLFETYLMRPLYMRSQGVNVGVSRTIPYRVTEVPYGMCQYKYKSVEKLAGTMLSNEQRKELKAEYERLKVEDLAKVA